ncbi:MAG: hypothetical protein ACNA8L_12270 [Luteolibacter sp.]
MSNHLAFKKRHLPMTLPAILLMIPVKAHADGFEPVVIREQPVVTEPAFSSTEGFSMTVHAPPGTYGIQASGDLSSWTPLDDIAIGEFSVQFNDPASTGLGSRFYSVVGDFESSDYHLLNFFIDVESDIGSRMHVGYRDRETLRISSNNTTSARARFFDEWASYITISGDGNHRVNGYIESESGNHLGELILQTEQDRIDVSILGSTEENPFFRIENRQALDFSFTTYSVNGIGFSTDDTGVSNLNGNSKLTFSFDQLVPVLRYSEDTDHEPGPLPDIVFSGGQPVAVSINGMQIGEEVVYSIGRLFWGEDKTTDVLSVFISDDEQYLFAVDGEPLPPFDTPEQLNSFFSAVLQQSIDLPPPGATFAPDSDIFLSTVGSPWIRGKPTAFELSGVSFNPNPISDDDAGYDLRPSTLSFLMPSDDASFLYRILELIQDDDFEGEGFAVVDIEFDVPPIGILIDGVIIDPQTDILSTEITRFSYEDQFSDVLLLEVRSGDPAPPGGNLMLRWDSVEESFVETALPLPTYPGVFSAYDIKAVDFDNDGLLDLAIMYTGGGGMDISGTFFQFLRQTDQGDFVDLTADFLGDIQVFTPDADRPGEDWAQFMHFAPVTIGLETRQLMAVEYQDATRVYLQDDEGMFQTLATLPGSFQHDVVIGDIYGDGLPEVVVLFNSSIDVYRLSGLDAFPTGLELAGSFGDINDYRLNPVTQGVVYPHGSALGDINGNGNLNLVVTRFTEPMGGQPAELLVFEFDIVEDVLQLADLTQSFLGPDTPALVDMGRDIALFDLNGDGVLDVIVGDHGFDGPPFPGAVNGVYVWDADLGHHQDYSVDYSKSADFTHSVAVGVVTDSVQPFVLFNNVGVDDAYLIGYDFESEIPITVELPRNYREYTTSLAVQLFEDEPAVIILGRDQSMAAMEEAAVRQVIFQLGGAPLPSLTNLEEFGSFLGSLTSINPIPADDPLGEGRPISLASLSAVDVSPFEQPLGLSLHSINDNLTTLVGSGLGEYTITEGEGVTDGREGMLAFIGRKCTNASIEALEGEWGFIRYLVEANEQGSIYNVSAYVCDMNAQNNTLDVEYVREVEIEQFLNGAPVEIDLQFADESEIINLPIDIRTDGRINIADELHGFVSSSGDFIAASGVGPDIFNLIDPNESIELPVEEVKSQFLIAVPLETNPQLAGRGYRVTGIGNWVTNSRFELVTHPDDANTLVFSADGLTADLTYKANGYSVPFQGGGISEAINPPQTFTLDVAIDSNGLVRMGFDDDGVEAVVFGFVRNGGDVLILGGGYEVGDGAGIDTLIAIEIQD